MPSYLHRQPATENCQPHSRRVGMLRLCQRCFAWRLSMTVAPIVINLEKALATVNWQLVTIHHEPSTVH